MATEEQGVSINYIRQSARSLVKFYIENTFHGQNKFNFFAVMFLYSTNLVLEQSCTLPIL